MSESVDAQTQASRALVWLIIANKPLYPVYVWYLVEQGAVYSLATAASLPLFFALLWLQRKNSLYIRAGLPLLGALDTVFETWLFGWASGTILFLAPVIMLTALGFKPHEKWLQRGLASLIFLLFLASRHFLNQPYLPFGEADLNALFALNSMSVAALMSFVALKYAGLSLHEGR